MFRKLRASGKHATSLAATGAIIVGGIAGSLAMSGQADAATLPARPVITGFSSVTNSGFTVSWKALPAGQTAELQVYDATTLQGYVHDSGLAGTSDPVTGLPAGTALYVRMSADKGGANSGWSSPVLAFTAATAGATGPAGPTGPGLLPYRTEVNDGSEFALSSRGNLADTSPGGSSYADAGIVVDDGPASSVTPADFAVTSSAPVAENVWIGNGPQASVDGVYPEGSTDYCYGLGVDYVNGAPTAFAMQPGKCGAYNNATLTIPQIAADFPNLEAYTWAGMSTTGPAISAFSISALGADTGLGVTVAIGSTGTGINRVLTPSVTTGLS